MVCVDLFPPLPLNSVTSAGLFPSLLNTHPGVFPAASVCIENGNKQGPAQPGTKKITKGIFPKTVWKMWHFVRNALHKIIKHTFFWGWNEIDMQAIKICLHQNRSLRTQIVCKKLRNTQLPHFSIARHGIMFSPRLAPGSKNPFLINRIMQRRTYVSYFFGPHVHWCICV